ncbi:MAG: hydantoinase B/oxoprolinase family protein, partial [Burkholderiaceae bacterium]
SIMVALNQLLCWDQYFAIGGALRHVEFNPTLGTMNCATFPASVSTAPVQAMEISLYPAYNVLSKMIYGDHKMREDIMCIGGTSQWPATIFRGTDQWGEAFGYLLVDPIGGAIGAFSGGDGISTGGQSRTPICKLPNIEHTEQTFPLLFLYRKEVVDSGGAGQYRGGMSAESCFIPHGTTRITHDTLSSGNAMPTSSGMMGGYPGSVNVFKFTKDSDIQSRFARSELPSDIAELSGEAVTLGLRQQNFTQEKNDVYSVIWTGAGGFGDPLERDPEAVWRDVIEHKAVSPEAAKAIYGVVIKRETLDTKATDTLRQKMRQTRKAQRHVSQKGFKPGAVLTTALVRTVTAKLAVRKPPKGERTKRWCCAGCSTDFGPISANYKLGCARVDAPIATANPNVGDWKRYIDQKPIFRQFFCPGCGDLIENEIARWDDPLLSDVEVKL